MAKGRRDREVPKVPEEIIVTCPNCNGHKRISLGTRHKAVCPFCHGAGTVKRKVR